MNGGLLESIITKMLEKIKYYIIKFLINLITNQKERCRWRIYVECCDTNKKSVDFVNTRGLLFWFLTDKDHDNQCYEILNT